MIQELPGTPLFQKGLVKFEPDAVFDVVFAGRRGNPASVILDFQRLHYGIHLPGRSIYIVTGFESALPLLCPNLPRNFNRQTIRKSAADEGYASGFQDPVDLRK